MFCNFTSFRVLVSYDSLFKNLLQKYPKHVNFGYKLKMLLFYMKLCILQNSRVLISSMEKDFFKFYRKLKETQKSLVQAFKVFGFISRKTLQSGKFKGPDFKRDNNFINHTPAQNYSNKGLLSAKCKAFLFYF